MSKPKVGTEVRVRLGPYDDDPWANATVHALLSKQFMAYTEAGHLVFGLYALEGDSWKRGW